MSRGGIVRIGSRDLFRPASARRSIDPRERTIPGLRAGGKPVSIPDRGRGDAFRIMRRHGEGPALSAPSPLNQPACKPGSVRRCCHHVTAIPLGRRLPGASSNLPGRQDPDTGPATCAARRPYSVLLPVGFAMPPPSPEARCALTAPFHPCRHPCGIGRFTFCGTVPEIPRACARFLPPDVIRHRMSMEPGLSSRAAFRHWRERPSGRLTAKVWGDAAPASRAPRRRG
jgi:hypothetical protein